MPLVLERLDLRHGRRDRGRLAIGDLGGDRAPAARPPRPDRRAEDAGVAAMTLLAATDGRSGAGSAPCSLLVLVYAFRPQPVPVDFAEVARGRLTVTVDEEGETRVRDVFVLSAPVAGRMRRIEMEVGDEVVAGETVVAEIEPVDPTLLDARSETEAQAAVRAAEAELEFASARARAPAAARRARRGVGARSRRGREGLPHGARRARERARRAARARAAHRARASARARRRRARAARTSDCVCIPVLAPVPGRVLRVVRESAGVVHAGRAAASRSATRATSRSWSTCSPPTPCASSRARRC